MKKGEHLIPLPPASPSPWTQGHMVWKLRKPWRFSHDSPRFPTVLLPIPNHSFNGPEITDFTVVHWLTSKTFFFFCMDSKPFLSSSGKLPLTNILPNPIEEKMSLFGSDKKPFFWKRKELWETSVSFRQTLFPYLGVVIRTKGSRKWDEFFW